MEFSIAVVDDLSQDRSRLLNDIREWIRKRGELESAVCKAFASGLDLLQNGGMAGRFSIVFLDILMEELNGMETAARLRAAQPDCVIIFVTTEKDCALEAYPLHPFDFLVKPYAQDRLDRLLMDVVRMLSRKSEEIRIRVARGEVIIPVSKIVSIVSRGHHVDFLLSDGKALSGIDSFAKVSAQMRAYPCFLEVNRGVLVNMDQAVCISNDSIILTQNIRYPLRVRHRSELIRDFTQYQIKHRMGGL